MHVYVWQDMHVTPVLRCMAATAQLCLMLSLHDPDCTSAEGGGWGWKFLLHE